MQSDVVTNLGLQVEIETLATERDVLKQKLHGAFRKVSASLFISRAPRPPPGSLRLFSRRRRVLTACAVRSPARTRNAPVLP